MYRSPDREDLFEDSGLSNCGKIIVLSVANDKGANKLASLEGFEPTTRCLEGSRSVQLSYRDIFYYSNVARGERQVKMVIVPLSYAITMLALGSP